MKGLNEKTEVGEKEIVIDLDGKWDITKREKGKKGKREKREMVWKG